MKKILFTLALLISFSSFGQNDIKQGLVTEYYENGKIETISNYVNGVKQGEEIGYFRSGKLSYKGIFVDGVINGEVIDYYESGAVKDKVNFVDGIPGEFKNYKDGELIEN